MERFISCLLLSFSKSISLLLVEFSMILASKRIPNRINMWPSSLGLFYSPRYIKKIYPTSLTVFCHCSGHLMRSLLSNRWMMLSVLMGILCVISRKLKELVFYSLLSGFWLFR